MSVSKIVEAAQKKVWLQETLRRMLDFPSRQDAALAALSAVMLVLAFPDFELWFLAWFALVPLLVAVERNKNSTIKSFWLGLLNGFVFFTGTCWWLTHAPINYGGIPTLIAYFLLFPATLGAGFFTGIFAAVLSRLLSKFGQFAILLAPFVWTACEFLRLMITGNAWNALGYSQAFQPFAIQFAQYGGIFLITFLLVVWNAMISFVAIIHIYSMTWRKRTVGIVIALFPSLIILSTSFSNRVSNYYKTNSDIPVPFAVVVALQPNVPMSGLTVANYRKLRERHVELAETALREIESDENLKSTLR